MATDDQMMDIRLLAPVPGSCPMCAGKHGADEPHTIESLYYRIKFRQEYGRAPTAEDAAAHLQEANHGKHGIYMKHGEGRNERRVDQPGGEAAGAGGRGRDELRGRLASVSRLYGNGLAQCAG